ncbi:MAG: hypothetical protein C0393_04540 [Anaerolinea sp.]|nr:hypothetical protein [Anaerolinea sp.]
MSDSRLGQVSCGDGEGLGVAVSVAIGVALCAAPTRSAMTSDWVGAAGWNVKGTYGMQMQAAVTTNKATTRIKIENLLFDNMITCIHSLAIEYSTLSVLTAKTPRRQEAL